MRIIEKAFKSIGEYNVNAFSLRKSIDTSYIPVGDSLREVIENFSKIQFSRSFSSYERALLSLFFDENALRIWYVSTSGTEVFINFVLDSNMNLSHGHLEVDIPDYRAVPGRKHYEEITKNEYFNTWHAGSQVPEGLDRNALEPEWLQDRESNKTSKEDRDFFLGELGYVPTADITGMLNAWIYKGEKAARYPLILEDSLNEFVLLEREESLITSSYKVFSWRRLLNVLNLPQKEDDDKYIDDFDIFPVEDDYNLFPEEDDFDLSAVEDDYDLFPEDER
jgi:hypothetical protein